MCNQTATCKRAADVSQEKEDKQNASEEMSPAGEERNMEDPSVAETYELAYGCAAKRKDKRLDWGRNVRTDDGRLDEGMK